MANASKAVLGTLQITIDAAAAGLTKVTGKKMFGCHALWANDSVFGLVWKEGRIGVRLPDEDVYAKLLALKGAVPWKAGKMVMSHWVLVPESMHGDRAKLTKWLAVAHGHALSAAPKNVKKIQVSKQKSKTKK